MSNISTFEDYQAKHTSILPEKLSAGLDYIQGKIHSAAVVMSENLPIPNLIIRTAQLGVTTLSYVPSIDPNLVLAKQTCKDAKNFASVLMGVKTIDAILHFKFSWKAIVLNISGMMLLILSAVSLLERFKLLTVMVTAIKVGLAALPIFGVLPFGGLFALSIVGLMGTVFIMSWENKRTLEQKATKIKDKKLVFWESLDIDKVRDKKKTNASKVAKSEEKVSLYERLIRDGKQVEINYGKSRACQKAIEELTEICKKEREDLERYKTRFAQWEGLERNWAQIDSHTVEAFRQAKVKKWQTKLDRVEYEKRAILYSMVVSSSLLARQIFTIATVACGFGIVVIPMLLNIGLDLVGTGCDIRSFWMKRSLKKMKKIDSVYLGDYENSPRITITQEDTSPPSRETGTTIYITKY